MILLTLALLMFSSPVTATSPEDLDDPKIVRLLTESDLHRDGGSPVPPKSGEYPSLQFGYLYGGSFGMVEPQGEHTLSMVTMPWQQRFRVGIGIELGILDTDPGGHLGLSLSLGYQRRFPWHWYVDLMAMGGVYRINLYQAEVIAPIMRTGLHGGVGGRLGRLHGTVGLALMRTDLFLSSGRISGLSVGLELRLGF